MQTVYLYFVSVFFLLFRRFCVTVCVHKTKKNTIIQFILQRKKNLPPPTRSFADLPSALKVGPNFNLNHKLMQTNTNTNGWVGEGGLISGLSVFFLPALEPPQPKGDRVRALD